MYRIEKYNSTYYAQWNDFINQSKNGTFLFHRDFMEYHSDRFTDYSLLVFKDDTLAAILPAHITDNKIYSHNGLTYGGLIYTVKTKLSSVIHMLADILQFLHNNDLTKLYVKLVPAIYHKFPSDEINYALFTANALLVRRDSLLVYDQLFPVPFTKERKECIRRGTKNELKIVEEPDFELFWNEILIPNLQMRHGVKPVHTLDEITRLQKKFPYNIRHFNVFYKNKIVAGTTVFITDNVVHPQYISGQGNKNELGSLDYLYSYLITNVFKHIRYFDFGISNEEQGRKLNTGLTFWKESFGARTIVQDFYEVDTKNYTLPQNALI